jgi:hypothetical protein
MRTYYYRLSDPDTVYGLIRDLFLAAAITCVLSALHRIADGLILTGRIKALGKFGDAYTPEEREILIHKVKVRSLH